MSSNCKNINPLKRSGVNQYQRVLEALNPGFVKADEHDYSDLILFAKNYSEQLKYYDNSNTENGDWSDLMGLDISVTLASLIKTNIEGCFGYSKGVLDQIKNSSTQAQAKKYFKVMFDFGYSVIKLLDEYYRMLPDGFEFKQFCGSTVSSNLPEYYFRLNKYYEEALTQGLIDGASEFKTDEEPVKIIFSQNFDDTILSWIWDFTPIPFLPAFNGTTDILKIKNTASHNLFTGIFDELLKTFSNIVHSSEKYLNEVINDFPEHSPHYALYITFIKLFRVAQDHLNEFTKRHLDLYYKEILGLKNNKAVPDEVHLIFELQKNTEQHLVSYGTVLKAGKDIDGEDIYYALEKDLVVNKGKVKFLKNLFTDKNLNSGNRKVYCCPVANSEDGLGGKLKSADESWKTFGSPETSPSGETGFVIGSPYLFLNGGKRDITFRFYSLQNESIPFSNNDIKNLFNIQLSGEKGWIDVFVDPAKVKIDPSKDFFEIKVSLDGGDDAVVPYSKQIHMYNFDVSMPVAKFTLNNSEAKNKVWDFSFEKVSIITNVSNLKNLKIQNDISILDPAKTFELFGFSANQGSSFVIGSKELFMKTLAPDVSVKGNINIKWDNYLNNYNNIKDNEIEVKVLENSEWNNLSSNINIITGKNSKSIKKTLSNGKTQLIKQSFIIGEFSDINFTLNQMDVVEDYFENENYSVKSKWGFLKLVSENTFELTNGDPYSPKVSEISINYSASSTHFFNDSEDSAFIQINPFGSKKNSGDVNRKQLLPSLENEGELYIGIEEFETDQTLSLLFKVAEGSADPLVSKEMINWSYLGKDNEWINFEDVDIEDSTDDLLNSGIIKFNISDKATSKNTLMTDQLHWIRATVKKNTDSICKMISVTAQAGTAEFYDYKGKGNYYKNILAPETINKLVVSDAAVKKIKQPYSSVKGKAVESDEFFYTRVSERLRHKNRAVTMWDYERIVLQKFPQIFKVKCINHSQILESLKGGKTVYTDNEIKPGYVLLIPIPDIRDQNAFDPLRPYTSLELLADIENYLYKYISPHVNLDVRNPLFEEIQLEFKVKFLTEDNSFFEKELKWEIEKYLSPWAYDPNTDIEFAGKINKSSLIDFIEERSYVDFISCVKMYKIESGIKSKDLEEAYAGTSRSVFVSVKSDDPENGHKISFIENECECDGK